MKKTPETSSVKVVIAALLLTAIGVGGVLVYDAPYIRAQEEDGAAAAPAISSSDQELFSIIDRINSIKLDEKIFTDPAFVSLKDISTIIAPQPVGRDNPFLPIPGSVAPAAR